MNGIKFGVIYLVLLGIFCNSCQTNLRRNDKNFILWQNPQQLTFKDFRGKSNSLQSKYLGHCETQYRFEHKVDELTKLPKFIIRCYFNKKLSFIRYKNDSMTLRHEQIHFNIEELFCRKVRKSWDSLNLLNIKKIGLYNKERNRIHRKNNLLNDLFHQEEYSIDGSASDVDIDKHPDSILKKWEVKIKEELITLEAYK